MKYEIFFGISKRNKNWESENIFYQDLLLIRINKIKTFNIVIVKNTICEVATKLFAVTKNAIINTWI